MSKRTVVQVIASSVNAYWNCVQKAPTQPHLEEWIQKHAANANELVAEYLPSGSGFDSATTLDLEMSSPDGNKLVFYTSFHHMDEYGEYDGWTSHTVTVRPSFVHRLDIKISGRNRGDIKEYVHEAFYCALTQEIDV